MVKFSDLHLNTIMTHWKLLSKENFEFPVVDEEIFNWLKTYLAAHNSGDPTAVRLDELFWLFRSKGCSTNGFIHVLNFLPVAIKSSLAQSFHSGSGRDSPSSLVLSEQMHRDLTEKLAVFFDKAIDKQEREYNKAATLLKVTKAASSSLEINEVLRVVATEITSVVGPSTCTGFLFPEHSQFGNYQLLEWTNLQGYTVPDPPEAFTLEALQSGQPVSCYDPALDPRTDKTAVKMFNLKSLLAFPLISKGKPVAAGLLCMRDYHHFTQEEIELVLGIASAGALAVENAKYHDSQMKLVIAQERNLLAQELHDRLAQTLAVVKLNLNSVLLSNSDPVIAEKISESKELVDDIYQDVRDAILGLRMLPDKDLGTLDEIREYLTTYGAHHNLNIKLLINESDFQILGGEAILQVARIIDEAVVNSCKHSHASNVWIKSGLNQSTFWTTVEDDGIGIDWMKVSNMQKEHFGLEIMRERALAAGGYLTITDRKDGGTVVTLEIPTEKVQ